MKGKIYYNNETKKTLSSFRPNTLIYNDIPSEHCIEVEEESWINFLSENQGKEFFVENGVLVAKDRVPTSEEKKVALLSKKKCDLKSLRETLYDKTILGTITQEEKSTFQAKLTELETLKSEIC